METSRDDFIIAIRSAFLKKENKQRFSLLGLVFFSIIFLSLFGRFFRVVSGRFLVRFWRVSEAKMDAKIDVWAFFFDLFFECVFGSISAWFLEARNLKNINFASTGARFLQNRYFQKNIQKMFDLDLILGGLSDKKSTKIVFENMLFWNIEFWVIFMHFCLHFGFQKLGKNRKFSKKLKFEGGLWSTITLELLLG